MRGSLVAIIIAVFVLCTAIGFWLTYSSTHAVTRTRTVCEVVEEKPIVKRIPVNNVTWIEIVEGKRVVYRCAKVVEERLCSRLEESGKTYTYCHWHKIKTLRTWIKRAIMPTRWRIAVKLNLTAYNKSWSRIYRCEALQCVNGRCWCVGKGSARIVGLISVVRYVCEHRIIFEVPRVVGSAQPINESYSRIPLYIREVLAPALKVLVFELRICGAPSNASLARAVSDLIASGRYCETNASTFEQLFARCSGICVQWTAEALAFARVYGWKAIDVASPQHSSAFLCEPWWRNQYGIVLEHPKLRCYLWVDTGALIQSWNKLNEFWVPTYGCWAHKIR